MKKMRKILAALLATTTILSLSACGTNAESGAEQEQPDVVASSEESVAEPAALPEGATRIPIPGLTDEGMNYVAIGYHGNTDAALSEMTIGELEGFEGNVVKARMKQLAEEPFWVFGIDLSEAEDSPCMDEATFTNLQKISFDYTCTEDYASEIFDGDLMLQLVWKYYEEVKGVQMENTALTAEMNIKFEKTDDIVTYTIDFANDYPEYAQTLAQAIADYDTLHLDYLQFGFHNGLSFDDDNPFNACNVKFGNVTLYCE